LDCLDLKIEEAGGEKHLSGTFRGVFDRFQTE
jgi:hypothetical protein